MRKYETIFISDPDVQDQVRDELFGKVKNIITGQNGYLIDFDDWGIKKLAYDIEKKSRGYYVCVTYGGTGDLVKELERNLRLNDSVIRYMTILICDSTTIEKLEKDAEEAKNKPKRSTFEEDDPVVGHTHELELDDKNSFIDSDLDDDESGSDEYDEKLKFKEPELKKGDR
jgi:small subunit ribosomal protein S6